MTSVLKCGMGSYGDGIICTQCPFATWTLQIGATDISKCVRSFTYREPGQIKSYIPFGVTQIVVKIWGGGGGSDNSSDLNFASHSGGGGGFSSCNLTVAHSRNVYVIVGGGGGAYSLSTNAGGFGGGGKGFAIAGYSSGGGGGRSAIQLVLGTDAVTAGGGGGGSDCLKTTGCGGGGGGGLVGGGGGLRGLSVPDIANGRGGTDNAGGRAGIGLYCNGTAGTKYQGGDGCRGASNAATAGGGGGYYGGGGGSAKGASDNAVDGGGGGGSSFGGGCNLGSFVTLQGASGISFGVSSSGGKLKGSYEVGVGEGGAANSRKPGGSGLVTIQLIPDESFRSLSPGPTSQPTSMPSGQPTGQPTSKPSRVPPSKRPTSQPTSRPTGVLRSNAAASNRIGDLTIKTAIIIFVCVGVVVLCLFIVFTYYCQNKFVNREEDRVHSLVEENYDDDEAVLDDGEGDSNIPYAFPSLWQSWLS
jgi:Glycine rich protein